MKKKILIIIGVILIIGALTGIYTYNHIKKQDYISYRVLTDDFKFLTTNYNEPCSIHINSYEFHLNKKYNILVDYYENDKKMQSDKYKITGKGNFYYRLELNKKSNKAQIFVQNTDNNAGYMSFGDLKYKNVNRTTELSYSNISEKKIAIKDNKKHGLGEIYFCTSYKDKKMGCENHNTIKLYIQKDKQK